MTLQDASPSELLRSWVAINDPNTREIDTALGGPQVLSYIPQLLGSNENPNLGTESDTGGVWFTFFNTVFVWGHLRFFGDGIDDGDGDYSITLPVAGRNMLFAEEQTVIGTTRIFDNDSENGPSILALNYFVGTELGGTSRFVMQSERGVTGNSLVGSDSPFVWNSTSSILFHVRYKT